MLRKGGELSAEYRTIVGVLSVAPRRRDFSQTVALEDVEAGFRTTQTSHDFDCLHRL